MDIKITEFDGADHASADLADIFGRLHSVRDVDMILTKSIFRGFGWMRGNGISIDAISIAL